MYFALFSSDNYFFIPSATSALQHCTSSNTKTMSSPTTNEAAVREAIRAIIAPMPIDKFIGQPTNLTVNLLKHQVAKIAAAVKTMSWGGRHGHLALVLDDDEYRIVTGNATQTTTRLVAPPIVPTALTNTTTLTLRARITADHNLECQQFWKQEAVDAVIVDKIVHEGVDAPYIEELDEDFIGYSAQMIKLLLAHLRREWCIVTTLERKQATAAFHIQWDLTTCANMPRGCDNLSANFIFCHKSTPLPSNGDLPRNESRK
jgi:hypothetical protein